MVALQIGDLKEFTKKLFIGETFDWFLVKEVNIVTFNTFTIDGTVRPGYYSKEELEEGRFEGHSAWKVLRPFCFSLIRGSRLPESLSVVLKLPSAQAERFLRECGSNWQPEQVGGLYLNIRYEDQKLHCVTGLSMNQFTLDRSLEREWDQMVQRFFKKAEIAYEL